MKVIFKSTFFTILCIVVLLSGCVPYKAAYKDSQTLLNQAVDIETAYRVQQLEKEIANPDLSAEARIKFDEAYKSIISFITEHSAALKVDNLYGNALALKGLAEYYLEKYDKANLTAVASISFLRNS